jgi:hypothetical protein
MLNLDLKYSITKYGKFKKNKESYLGEYINLKYLLQNKVKYVSLKESNLNLMGFKYKNIKKKLMILVKIAQSDKILIYQDRLNDQIIFINKKYLIDIFYAFLLINYNFGKNINENSKYNLLYFLFYFNYTKKYLNGIKDYQRRIINQIFYKYFIYDNIKREELIKFRNFHDLYNNIKEKRVYKKFLKIKNEIVNSNDCDKFNNLYKEIKSQIVCKESPKKYKISFYNNKTSFYNLDTNFSMKFIKFKKNNVLSIVKEVKDKNLRLYLNSIIRKY